MRTLTTKKSALLGAALVPVLVLTACGDAKQTGTSGKKAAGSVSASGTGSDTTSDPPDNPPATGASADVLGAWCTKVQQTKAVQEHMGDVIGKLCDGNKPTSFFATTLVKTAYNGGDKVSLQALKLSTAGSNTTGDFGVGIKLPISAKDHFAKVGPKGGDPDSVKKLAEAQGAKGQAEILKTYKKGDDKYLERGWQLHSKTTKHVIIIDKTQDSNNESMQYDLDEGGKAFMYAQYIVKPIEGVSAYSLLTAAVQIGDDSYLLTAAHVTVDNSPGGKLAEPQVKDAAEKVVVSQYNAAAAAR